MIGPQGVDSLKQIGPKLLSLLLIETSMQIMLVFGIVENHHAHHQNPLLPLHHGYHKSWIQLVNRGWGGCRRTTWFIITVQIRRDFHKVFHWNALTLSPIYRTSTLCIISFFYFMSYIQSLFLCITIYLFFHFQCKISRVVVARSPL